MNCTDSETESDKDIESESIVNRLTEVVRKHYRSHLEKLLHSNYEVWCERELGFKEPPLEKDIVKCAEIYEDKAIKACMIAQFYRRAMLKIMDKIRTETKTGSLSSKLQILIQNDPKPHHRRYAEVSTQTDNNEQECEFISLQDKMDRFQDHLRQQQQQISHIPNPPRKSQKRPTSKEHKNLKNRKKLKPHPALPSPRTPPPTEVPKLEDDDIAKELDLLFKEDKTEVEEIFGSPEPKVDPLIENVLKEIEECKVRKNVEQQKRKTEQLQHHSRIEEVDLLKDSLWPCELHHQQMQLRYVLGQVADRDLRSHERIKDRFVELFGEDDDDEFAPYSPTLELNEVLLSSCKKRIAPWVVRNLMPPLNEGLIANRYLFKKLAKRLAHSIILENQYPDEQYIKSTVEDFFCMHRSINSIEDIVIC